MDWRALMKNEGFEPHAQYSQYPQKPEEAPNIEDIENIEDTSQTLKSDSGEVVHGLPVSELRDLAGDDWPLIKDSPLTLSAFAQAVQIRRMRERGERPAHYTKAVTCTQCGPVMLWPESVDHVLGCPWCFNRTEGKPIPRPHLDTAKKETSQ